MHVFVKLNYFWVVVFLKVSHQLGIRDRILLNFERKSC